MASQKFLRNNGGIATETASVDTSAGAADSGKIPALNTSGVLAASILNATNTSAGAGDAGKTVILDSSGRLDGAMMPVGIGADTASIVASEALAAGDYVNVWDDAGTPKVRKADATTAGKEAQGFVIASVSSAALATVYFEGTNTAVTGQTAGAVFLSTTAGAGTATVPTGAGNVAQVVGFATSATSVNFQSRPPIVLA